MTTTPPILREWHGLKPPEIRTVGSLNRSITPGHYSQVYWIKTVRAVDNAIIESHPLKSWHFAADGRLIGKVDTGAWQQVVEINTDEYVILSIR
jgi:hypothetical protein